MFCFIPTLQKGSFLFPLIFTIESAENNLKIRSKNCCARIVLQTCFIDNNWAVEVVVMIDEVIHHVLMMASNSSSSSSFFNIESRLYKAVSAYYNLDARNNLNCSFNNLKLYRDAGGGGGDCCCCRSNDRVNDPQSGASVALLLLLQLDQ